MPQPVLQVEDLRTRFPTERGTLTAVDGISFAIAAGEVLGLVGESGCGKSLTARSILRLVPPPGRIVSGRIFLHGRNILELSEAEMRGIRGADIALVFQNPMTSLNPALTIGWQLREALLAHQRLPRAQARRKAVGALQAMGIPDAERRIDDYPHRFSGGMRQRVLIAMALLNEPGLLIADEPTTALDVTIQAQILELLRGASAERRMAVLLITHDLGVVASLCRRVAVMYAGHIVEEGAVDTLFATPLHPYTQGLLRSLPRGHEDRTRLTAMPGMPPDMIDLPTGCRFRQRCAFAEAVCEQPPELVEVSPGRSVRCWISQRDGRLAPPGEERRAVAVATTPKSALRVPLVQLREVTKRFSLSGALLGRGALVHSLNGVSLDVMTGETLGVVGESGCGKSTLGRIALGLYRPTTGTVRVDGRDPGDRIALRHQLQMIFQDPSSSLDPRMRVAAAVAEPLRARGALRGRDVRDRVRELMMMVGLSEPMADRFPHELSGGQQQRVGIARALAGDPRLIVADEPVSSLDVSQQAQVLNLLKDLQARLGLTYLFISHDLSIVRFMSARIAVMYLGKIVELGPARAVLTRPLHPYSIALRSAVPIPDPRLELSRARIILRGDVPSPLALPSGCLFRTRCPVAQEICAHVEPPLIEHDPGRWAACHFVGSFDEALQPTRKTP